MRPNSLPREPIETIQDLLDHIEDRFRREKRRHAHVRLWFRGHADASWRLQPGVYREGFISAKDAESDATDEEGRGKLEPRRLKKERRLTEDFRVESAGLRTQGVSETDLYFLQQHYGVPTRLLDWTTNALTALFFCVCNEERHNVDGAVFFLDAWKFARSRGSGGLLTSRNRDFETAVHVISRKQDPSHFPEKLIPVRPDRFDPRIGLQRAGFTFHVPRQWELTQERNTTLCKILVAGLAKPDLKEQLAVLGIDEFAVYGDLGSLARRLNWAYDASRLPKTEA